MSLESDDSRPELPAPNVLTRAQRRTANPGTRGIAASSKKKIRPRRERNASVARSNSSSSESDNERARGWIQCSECDKWRLVSYDDDEFWNLPGKSVCCRDFDGHSCDDPADGTVWKNLPMQFDTCTMHDIPQVCYNTYLGQDQDPVVSVDPFTKFNVTTPVTLGRALRGDHGSPAEWRAAIQAEYDKVVKKYGMCGDTVPWSSLPKEATVVYSHVILVIKHTELEEKFWRKKARLVAQGNKERSVEDWNLQNTGDYWTPVANLRTLRMTCHYAATCGYDISTADVESAYLQGEITGPPIYIVLPKEMDPSGLPRKMHKPLYGL